MICPTCGEQVPESEVCSNCGAILLATGQLADADFGTPGADDLPDTDQAQASGGGEGQKPAFTPRVSSSALVLVIVGLALSLLFFTCIPGIVCSIISLVLNAKNDASGLDNPHRTPVRVLGVIGLVVGILMLAGLVSFGIIAKQVIDTVHENGWELSEVQIVRDDDGSLVIRETVDSSADNASTSAVDASSSASASSKSSSSAGLSSASAGSSAASSSADRLSLFVPECLDGLGNPTLYALLELDGKQLQELLEADGFGWYDEVTAWINANGAVFEGIDKNGAMKRSDIDKLKEGAVGSPALLMLSVKGYATPAAALEGLGANVEIVERHDDSSALFAVAHDANGEDHLVVITKTGDNEQTLLVYSDESVKQGLFRDTIGIDAGKSVTEVWDTIAG